MNNEPVSYVTALDLADMMQEYSESGFQYPLCMELKYVAVMLRQQQAEIVALKNELKRYADAIGEERGNKALKNHEIAAILTQVLDDCGLLKKENP
jgi:hypothetical protein